MACGKLFTVASNRRNANKILQHYYYQIIKDLDVRPSQDPYGKQKTCHVDRLVPPLWRVAGTYILVLTHLPHELYTKAIKNEGEI